MKVAVIIPAYKVKKHILELLGEIGEEVDFVIVVDDCCPEQSGKYVEESCTDLRVKVAYNKENLGVGGAVKTGFKLALQEGYDICVKLDGDGQMSPHLIKRLIDPITKKEADYAKGNRFYNLESLNKMPALRLFGNSALSLINKFVNGYWNIMDPTNGFIAIHKNALRLLPLDKIENRYFFESDMLFRLSTINAVVTDMPMDAIYEDEESNLSISRTALSFPSKYLNRFLKRIFYNYFLRDFNIATLEIIFGTIFLCFGVIAGTHFWIKSSVYGILATTGQVMIASLPILIGFILLMLAAHVDVASTPKKPLCLVEMD
ncbi:glycosyltransferase family 2 protein [uncultured Draconibacterium sp.]|uniref:glycosyltransferase family 2 protein n=1 Tax=uncultured Draconibacterium sp. TaxID=1573823 RepID=UPI0025DE0E2C|nr:glycosyltransferase family 2 protein [uncultured Draconibacterium sp.]